LSQSERNHALQALRDGRARVCVATDVAARGIDLPSLSLVIHADLPNDAQVLQHRSGRTGRAGKKGVSVLLVPPARRRRAEEMLGRAKVTATWGDAPSADAIRKVDQERLLQNPLLVEPGSEDDLAMADELLKLRSPRELAAAFVKMYRAGLPAPEEIEDESYPQSNKPAREHSSRKEGPRNDGPREHAPREHTPREHSPREHAPREPRSEGPRAPRPRPHQTGERQHAPTHERGAAPGAMANGVWFRLNVGRERNADPKWLLPEICRQGEVTKKEIGAIRVFEMETLFQVAPDAAPKFTILVSERKKGGVRISPALDQSGESTARPREEKPHNDRPREVAPRSDEAPGGAPPRKPGFHGKKFGDKKKFGGKKFGKPGGGYKGKNPRPKPQA
jgi:ATP-dependent RNA helicase DeaD